MKKNFNFEQIWHAQELTSELREALEISSASVKEVILRPGSSGYQNITEWAKQKPCWDRVSKLEVQWPESLSKCFISSEDLKSQQQAAKSDQKVLNGIAAQEAVLKADPKFWIMMRDYGVERSILSDRDLMILNVASRARETGMVPTDKQCAVLLKAYVRLQEEGFPDKIEG